MYIRFFKSDMSGQERLRLPYFIHREAFVLKIAAAAVRDKLLTEKNNIIYKSLASCSFPQTVLLSR